MVVIASRPSSAKYERQRTRGEGVLSLEASLTPRFTTDLFARIDEESITLKAQVTQSQRSLFQYVRPSCDDWEVGWEVMEGSFFRGVTQGRMSQPALMGSLWSFLLAPEPDSGCSSW